MPCKEMCKAVKVLLIEPSKQAVKELSICLHIRYPGATVLSVAEGQRGIDMVEAEVPDLVIVSSSLHDMDRLDLIREVRNFSDVPIIILFEGETAIDRASCLELGADDYANRPLSAIDLLAKVNAVLRRTHNLSFTPASSFSFGDKFLINFAKHEVLVSGKPVKLTRTEYVLLSELVRNEGRVLTHHSLLEKVWGSECAGDHSFVKKYIYRLRSKLEADARKPQMLLAERGIGYKFVRPV